MEWCACIVYWQNTVACRSWERDVISLCHHVHTYYSGRTQLHEDLGNRMSYHHAFLASAKPILARCTKRSTSSSPKLKVPKENKERECKTASLLAEKTASMCNYYAIYIYLALSPDEELVTALCIVTASQTATAALVTTVPIRGITVHMYVYDCIPSTFGLKCQCIGTLYPTFQQKSSLS